MSVDNRTDADGFDMPDDDRAAANLEVPRSGRVIDPSVVVSLEEEKAKRARAADASAAAMIPRPATTFTDLGNAERFVNQHKDSVRYCDALGGWFEYSGTHWIQDETLSVRHRAHATVRALYREVADIARALSAATDKSERERLQAQLDEARKHAASSEHTNRIDAMLREARAIPPLAIAQSAFDDDGSAWLLNVANGTLDLRTGELRAHNREDFVTKCAAFPFDATASAPRFEAFLERILPDSEVRAFVQRWAGYAATGFIREHVLPIWYGTGANGKSTLAELLSNVLGAYATACPAGFFEEQKYRKHETEIARLRGARLAVASETERSAHLAEARVKDLTGGEKLTARFMRGDHFTFRPTCKFVLLTNHKPRIRSTDDGIRRRLVMIPFGVTIPAGERDLSLMETLLREEGAGILRWVVDGARELIAHDWRLGAPDSIRLATDEYLQGEDVVGRFIEEACTVVEKNAKGLRDGTRNIRCAPTFLFERFRAWCARTGESACDQRDFAQRMRAHGFEAGKGAKGARFYFGIAPLADEVSNAPESSVRDDDFAE